MLQSPFSLLRQFDEVLDVKLLIKEDQASNDFDTSRITGAKNLVSLKQMHGKNIITAREPSSRLHEADGIFTEEKNLTITIRFADCQNFVLFAPKHKVAGVVHAGWRGLKSHILTAAFGHLKEGWGIEPKDVFVAAGPSLCAKCAEFTDPKIEAPELTSFVSGNCINLVQAAETELDAIGVPKNQRERILDCPKDMNEKYFSYRGGDREKVKDGFTNLLAVTIRK